MAVSQIEPVAAAQVEQVVEPLERALGRLELLQDRALELLTEVRAQRAALEFVLETLLPRRPQVSAPYPQLSKERPQHPQKGTLEI